MVAVHFKSHVRVNQLDDPFQSTYTENHSTETVLVHVHNHIPRAHDNHEVLLLLFFFLIWVQHSGLLTIVFFWIHTYIYIVIFSYFKISGMLFWIKLSMLLCQLVWPYNFNDKTGLNQEWNRSHMNCVCLPSKMISKLKIKTKVTFNIVRSYA